MAAASGLKEIGQRHPSARAECVDTLTRLLERFQDHDKAINANLIAGLLELHAVESAPVIERAFAAGCVDNSVSGDWQDVQIELGLAHERTTPAPNYMAQVLGPELSAKIAKVSRQIQDVKTQGQSRRTKAKKRDKRKQPEPRRKKKP